MWDLPINPKLLIMSGTLQPQAFIIISLNRTRTILVAGVELTTVLSAHKWHLLLGSKIVYTTQTIYICMRGH